MVVAYHTHEFQIPTASEAEVAAGTESGKVVTPATLGSATAFATAAQGALADTAIQAADLSTVATSGAYADLSGTPTLGTAAAAETTDFATAAQGALADTSIQPADLATVATSGSYADLTGLPTLGTAAAANTGDFATAAQGALADSAVQIGDAVAPAITANTMLVDNPAGTARETKTFAEVLALLPDIDNAKLADMATATIKGRATAGTGVPEDLTTAQTRDLLEVDTRDDAVANPLAGFNADGSTSDEANFTALRANPRWADAAIDLRGGIYLVDGIPSGCWYNGAFKTTDGFCHAMPGFFDIKFGSLPRTNGVNLAFQGAGFSYSGMLGLFYAAGDATTIYPNATICYSKDSGNIWEPPRTEFTASDFFTVTTQLSIGASVIYNNRWAILAKGANSGPEPWKMLSKPIPRYETKQVSVSTVASDATITINWDKHGLRTGDTVTIAKFADASTTSGAVVGGVALADVNATGKTATRISSSAFSIEMDAGTATSADTKTLFVGVYFNNRATWEEILWGGDNFETEFLGASTILATGMTDLIMIQGYSEGGTNPDFLYTAFSGNNNVCGIARFPQPQSGPSASFQLKLQFNEGASNVLAEPTIAYQQGQIEQFGFIRTQNPSLEHPHFWCSDDDCTTHRQGPIPLAIGDRSPWPCALGDDGYIYALGTERLTSGTGVREQKPIYLLRGKKSEAFAAADGACGNVFETFIIGEVDILANAGNTFGLSNEASNTGRATAVKHGSWIFFFYEEEEIADLAITPSVTYYTNVKYVAINTDPTRKTFPATRFG